MKNRILLGIIIMGVLLSCNEKEKREKADRLYEELNKSAKSNQLEKSQKIFQEIMVIDKEYQRPNSTRKNVHAIMGSIYYSSKIFEQALLEYKTAISQSEDYHSYEMTVMAAILLGQYSEALVLIEETRKKIFPEKVL